MLLTKKQKSYKINIVLESADMNRINNKGQALVSFLLLLPLFVLFLGVTIENCYLYSEKQKVKGR